MWSPKTHFFSFCHGFLQPLPVCSDLVEISGTRCLSSARPGSKWSSWEKGLRSRKHLDLDYLSFLVPSSFFEINAHKVLPDWILHRNLPERDFFASFCELESICLRTERKSLFDKVRLRQLLGLRLQQLEQRPKRKFGQALEVLLCLYAHGRFWTPVLFFLL